MYTALECPNNAFWRTMKSNIDSYFFRRKLSVVKDATAAAKHLELGDGYATALTNFGFIANAVLSTEEARRTLRAA